MVIVATDQGNSQNLLLLLLLLPMYFFVDVKIVTLPKN